MGRDFGFEDTLKLTNSANAFGFSDREDIGVDLVNNGGFDADISWVKVGDATITGGVALVVEPATTAGTFRQTIGSAIVEGAIYKLTFDLNAISIRTLSIRLGDQSTELAAVAIDETPGTLVYYLTATAGTVLQFSQSGTGGGVEFDNVVLQRT